MTLGWFPQPQTEEERDAMAEVSIVIDRGEAFPIVTPGWGPRGLEILAPSDIPQGLVIAEPRAFLDRAAEMVARGPTSSVTRG